MHDHGFSEALHTSQKSFSFPKQDFDKMKLFRDLVSLLGFSHGHAGLHYDETNYRVLCYLCCKAVNEKEMEINAGSADEAFVSCYS